MKRFVEGVDPGQGTLFPELLDDFVEEDNAVRVIEAFVEALDLGELGFGGVDPKATGSVAFVTYFTAACCFALAAVQSPTSL